MAFHVRDPETDGLVRRYARARRVGVTEAIKLAVRDALSRAEADLDEQRRALRAITDPVALAPSTGLEADKAFFDNLSGEA